MEKVNAADGLPDPYSFTTEEWLYLQEMGIAAGLDESIGLAEEELVRAEQETASVARATAMFDTYMKRKNGSDPSASYVDSYVKAGVGEYTHEYKMERAKKAGEGWMGFVFLLAVSALIGWVVA